MEIDDIGLFSLDINIDSNNKSICISSVIRYVKLPDKNKFSIHFEDDDLTVFILCNDRCFLLLFHFFSWLYRKNGKKCKVILDWYLNHPLFVNLISKRLIFTLKWRCTMFYPKHSCTAIKSSISIDVFWYKTVDEQKV